MDVSYHRPQLQNDVHSGGTEVFFLLTYSNASCSKLITVLELQPFCSIYLVYASHVNGVTPKEAKDISNFVIDLVSEVFRQFPALSIYSKL